MANRVPTVDLLKAVEARNITELSASDGVITYTMGDGTTGTVEVGAKPDALRVNTSNELTKYDGTTHVDSIKLGQSTSDGASADADGELIVEGTVDYDDGSGQKSLTVIEIKEVPYDESSSDTYMFSPDNYGAMTIVERYYTVSTDGTRTLDSSAKYMTDQDLFDTSGGTPDDMGYYQFWPDLLPRAAAETLGAVKVGDGLSIDEDGILSSESSSVLTDDEACEYVFGE